MTKVFLITQFGKPHEWTERYINNVQKLGQFGWYWKIFTPNKFESKGNVEIIPMNIEQFNDLVLKQCGVKPTIHLTEENIPSFHITEFYIFMGKIMQDYIKGFDFWGMTGLDNVFGRLDHFVPDSLLADCAMYSDDVDTVNGNFSLWRNNEQVNTLYQRFHNWKDFLSQLDCPGCCHTGEHRLYSPEDMGTAILTPGIRFKTPKYYDFHGHDRLINHEIVLKDDGSLWELNRDTWSGGRTFGREIAYYHFNTSKHWPL